MEKKVEVTLVNAEILKFSLQPGDALLIKVNGPDFEDDAVSDALRDSLRALFPNNKVGVLYMGKNTIEPLIISAKKEELPTGCNTASYCADCSCGKKEIVEFNNQQETK